MTEDVAHYVSLAREADGPIVELMVGSGRVAIEVVRETGKPVLGIDSSPAMLEIARERSAGLPLELRLRRRARARARRARGADLRSRSARSSTCTAGRRSGGCSSASRASLRPGGRFAFNAFVFSHTIAARLDGTTQDQSGVVHTLRYVPADNRIEIERDDAATIRLWWATKSEWDGLLDVAGLEVEALYGGFDARAVRRRVARVRLRRAEALSVYDPIARLYDPWSASVDRGHLVLRRRGARGGRRGRRARRRHRPDRHPDRAGRRARDRRRLVGGDARGLRRAGAGGRRRGAARPAARRPAPAAGGRARPARDVSVPLVSPPARRRRAARGARAPPASCCGPAGASSSTSSRRPARTSRRRTAAGSSASPASTSAPTGISRRRRSRSRCAARRARRR